MSVCADGGLDEAARPCGQSPNDCLDLSTAVSPRGYPFTAGLVTEEQRRSPPSPSAIVALEAAARSCYGARSEIAVAATPGSDAVVRALPALLAEPVVLLPTSCDSYHEAFAGRGRLRESPDLAALSEERDCSVVLVNPNAPDGRMFSPRDVMSIVHSRRGGAAVVVDEAFADAESAVSIVPYLRGEDRVLVLRSFSTFFGLPNLGLSFIIGHSELVEVVAASCGDRPPSDQAVALATAALQDRDWQREARHWLGNQAQAVDAVLARAGLKLRDGTRLFRLAEAADARSLHESLARQGILTRIFNDWPDLIRFGLPPDRDGLRRLAAALGG